MVGKLNLELDRSINLPSIERFKELGPKALMGVTQGVIVSINLKNLKYFNEIYSPREGDWLIQFMAEYFCQRNPDYVLGCRSYVDHLLLLTEGKNLSKEALVKKYEEFCNGFLDEVNKKYVRAKVHLECGMYIMQPGDDFLTAQDNARYARRSINNSYRTTVAYYSDDLRNKSMEKAAVIPDFRRALEEHEIMVLLQPKYSASQGHIVGAEALSRFANPEGELVSPAIYVPILENSGLISELDREVIFRTISLQQKWMEEGKHLFPISVNLSRMDFFERGFLEEIDQRIEQAGIPKSCIEFELTETAIVENLNEIVEKLTALRSKGYRIALDDFGSGYNSLYVLGRIPANVIKFDRGFVLYSIQNEIGKTILRNLVDTFKSTRFEVLCEGVETEEEKQQIVECGCDVIQGFLYDRPLPIAQFEEKYIVPEREIG